ncbi:hypothetical protein CHUAL_000082 [Chamberlinius hualienensis]
MEFCVTVALLTVAIFGWHGDAAVTLSVSPVYTSLSGDYDVIYNLTSLLKQTSNVTSLVTPSPVTGLASLLCGNYYDSLASIDVTEIFKSSPVGKFTFKCGSILYGGGNCYVKVTIKMSDGVNHIVDSGLVEVRWPSFRVTAPASLETFTSDVIVSLEATGIACPPISYRQRTWLEMSYGGDAKVTVTTTAVTVTREDAATRRRVIIAEVNEFYKIISRDFSVPCSSFDQAGIYRIRLVTNTQRKHVMVESESIAVKWSERYGVGFERGDAAFPCDSVTGGVTVFYQHPKCIFLGDKIRIYGRESGAPNAPAASPAVYRYIQEKRVEMGRNALTFSCQDFQRRNYVEYCVKYVSVAQHGAVTEVKSNCVTTQGSVAVTIDGRWSIWSSWSSCTGSCSVGSKTRHRVCDNPSPANGGRFCVGHPVQSEACRLPPCPEKPIVQSPVETFHMSDECRCGCHINMTTATVYVASSGFICPSATASWTFSVDESFVLRFTFVHFDLNDTAECLQIRNGKLPSSELLLHETGKNLPRQVITSLPVALLRYHSTPIGGQGGRLGMGFVVKVEPVALSMAGVLMSDNLAEEAEAVMVFSPLHLTALVFCVILICFTLSLVVQHIWNIARKRQTNEQSPQSPLTGSPGSFRGHFYPPFHPVTSTTSVSEVSVKNQIQLRGKRKHNKKCGTKTSMTTSASMDSFVSGHCKSPEDYMRDSKLFQTSLSSLESQNSEVESFPSPTKVQSSSSIVPVHPKQQPLILQTPSMGRKLPVATVSPQPHPVRVVSPTESTFSSAKKKLKSVPEHSAAEYDLENDDKDGVPSTSSSTTEQRKKKMDHSGVRLRTKQGRQGRDCRPNSSRTLLASMSEFSLSENDEDNFEYDYYDYGVNNMQPGSYLSSGQYPSWLPPFLPVQPSPYTVDVPLQHFGYCNGAANNSGSNSVAGSRPISDASTYQESSADSLMTPVHQTNIYNQVLQSPTSPQGRNFEKISPNTNEDQSKT